MLYQRFEMSCCMSWHIGKVKDLYSIYPMYPHFPVTVQNFGRIKTAHPA